MLVCWHQVDLGMSVVNLVMMVVWNLSRNWAHSCIVEWRNSVCSVWSKVNLRGGPPPSLLLIIITGLPLELRPVRLPRCRLCNHGVYLHQLGPPPPLRWNSNGAAMRPTPLTLTRRCPLGTIFSHAHHFHSSIMIRKIMHCKRLLLKAVSIKCWA